MDLYGLKEDSMEAGTLGAAVLVGAAVAKVVVDKGAALVAPTPAEDSKSGKAENKDSALRKYVVPLVPAVVGIAIHSYGKARFPVAAPGVAAGMVAVSIGRLVSNFLEKPKADAEGKVGMDIATLLPGGRDSALNGLGFTYDSGLMGLGYSYGAGVDAYMNGAPTQVQSLQMAGMPVQVQSLQGLGSTIVGGSSPLSASLM